MHAELGGVTFLTDPWFRSSMFFSEAANLLPKDLPKLDVVLGGHWAFDHWDMASLSALPGRASIRVRVADHSMVRPALKAGFQDVAVMAWGSSETVDGVSIEAIEEHALMGKRSTNFVLTHGGSRVFIGTEALSLEAAGAFAERHPPCDVVLGPVNGVHLLGIPLVASASQMVRIAKTVGARTFIPIHDSHKPIWGLQRVRSSADDLRVLDTTGLEVLVLRVGESHTLDGCSPVSID